jgi:hypothetical protein
MCDTIRQLVRGQNESVRLERIFNAFFTTKSQGPGLGLAITRSIVTSHGGRVWASANPGRGASFHVTLPSKAGFRMISANPYEVIDAPDRRTPNLCVENDLWGVAIRSTGVAIASQDF